MVEISNPLPAASLGTLLRGAVRRRRGEVHQARGATAYHLDGIDARHVAAYGTLLGFAPGAVPVTYYYLLAQRAHVAAMVAPDFPFRLAGMIHVSNLVEEYAAPSLQQSLQLRNVLTIEPPAADGARYCVFETLAGQEGRPLFRCESRYLAVRGARRPRSAAPTAPCGVPVGGWTLPSSEGRRYARASGDWNPIHLWPWSARLLGLRQPIIHGMHSVGKACAQLEQAAGRRVVRIGAAFVAPLPLGGSVRLTADWRQGCYAVLGERLAVEGSFAVL